MVTYLYPLEVQFAVSAMGTSKCSSGNDDRQIFFILSVLRLLVFCLCKQVKNIFSSVSILLWKPIQQL